MRINSSIGTRLSHGSSNSQLRNELKTITSK